MIHRARFQNFKALKDVEVTFDERLTVLVGPNGSGKSSVLRGIYWLCQMAADETYQAGIQAAVSSLGETFSGGDDLQSFQITQRYDSDEVGIRFRAHPTATVSGATPTADARNWDCVILSLRGRLEIGLSGGRVSSVPWRHERTDAVPE